MFSTDIKKSQSSEETGRICLQYHVDNIDMSCKIEFHPTMSNDREDYVTVYMSLEAGARLKLFPPVVLLVSLEMLALLTGSSLMKLNTLRRERFMLSLKPRPRHA